MPEQKTKFTMPRQSIFYLLLCLSGILIFIFFSIIPNYKSLKNMDQEISKIRMQVEEQKALFPVYAALNKGIQQDTGKRSLPVPAKQKLLKKDIENIFKTCRQIAGRSGMEMVSLFPDMNSLANGAGLLEVNGIFKGSFFNFRKLLTGLGSLPYLEYVEGIDIQEVQEGKDGKPYREYRVKLYLAVE